MELRHLRYFIAVAEELSFRRAAERLHVSQPPLSQQIKRLEEEVQIQLFDRTTRWVRLTSAGRLLLEHARHILVQVESAVLAARGTLGPEGNRLSVAFSPWAILTAMPHILRRLSEVHRHIQIHVQTLNSVLQVRAVKAKTVDVGFMLPPVGDEALHIERLATYPLVVALPVNHRLAARAQLSPADLAGESYVTLASDVAPAYGEIVHTYWRQAGVEVKERFQADEPHAVIDLVAVGAGFALVPLVQEFRKKQIVCRRLSPPPPGLDLSLVWAGEVESSAISSLLAVARQISGRAKSRISDDRRVGSHSNDIVLSEPGSLRQFGRARTNDSEPDQLSRLSVEPRARRPRKRQVR